MKVKILVATFIALDALLAIYLLLSQSTLAVLSPAGIIAAKERTLMGTVVFLGLIIIVPLVIGIYVVVFTNRRGTTYERYMPDWNPGPAMQAVWWVLPTIIIVIIAVLTWNTSHDLDPTKSLKSKAKSLTVQVVALRWKWLFIYPEQHIATVNYVVFPEKTPVVFELTADAPMNSFWIPRLGGQMYAMEGMVNKTHLMADHVGEYQGSSAEISGPGFASMRFVAKATTQDEFTQWVQSVSATNHPLTSTTYAALAKPSENTPHLTYSPVNQALYKDIVMKFMAPTPVAEKLSPQHKDFSESMPGMQM